MTTHRNAIDIDAEIDPALPQCPICDGPVVVYVEMWEDDDETLWGRACCCLCGHRFDHHEEATACEVWDLVVRDLKPEVIG